MSILFISCGPLHPLSFTWNMAGDKTPRDHPTRVTFQLQPMDDSTVKFTLSHELLEKDFVYGDNTFEGIDYGWPAILSNMKNRTKLVANICRSGLLGVSGKLLKHIERELI
ncbi:SRPBCC domain-containing protein [Peribacillus sp. NPDC006672]|uniref:SRPBCC domain-containing protein n=1 Tax=Peribacillus sp. NPDC006672 TaxID=3390606 RepID=UPI003CFF865E